MLDPLREFDKDTLTNEPAAESTEAGLLQGDLARHLAPEADDDSIRRQPRESEQDTAHVAVVFVHGMGTSKPGDMLENYMNPSLEWIKRATTDDHSWYHHNDLGQNLIEGVNILERQRRQGPAPASRRIAAAGDSSTGVPESPTLSQEVDIERLRNALLHSTETTPAIFQPPYVEVDLVMLDGDHKTSKKLVAVEAWWDGEFEAPSFRQVAQWSLGVAPSLILRHLALVWETDSGTDEHALSVSVTSPPPPKPPFARRSHWVSATLFTVVGGFIAILFQWAICLLLMLGSIPFLQKYVSAIILKMTTSFGDVLVYVHDGVRSAAIRSTVLRSFLWLSTNFKIEKLIVIGHSLGSVVSYDVLNSRDIVQRFAAEDVSFVTFGSPLKKTNILLHLKRDEQRVSLGMLFATLSFLCAIAALYVVSIHNGSDDTGGLSPGQWLIIVGIAFASAGIGVGAHMRPVMRQVPGLPYLLNLSTWQYLGVILGAASSVVFAIESDSFWRFAALIPAIGLLLWSVPVSISRLLPAYNATRLSQTLGFGFLLLGLTVLAGLSGTLPLVATLLLAALVLSVMTGSNPLEEFEREGNAYKRVMPNFSFQTPIRKWIDFWATNDLVSEFGLGDCRYRIGSEGEFDKAPISRRITNMKSYIGDHTSYRQNMEQFITPLTRMFLEELGFRAPNATAGQDMGAFRSWLGYTPVSGNYEQDIANAARSRAQRVHWLGLAGGLLMLTAMLFSPGVYRSIGEFIVFDERNPAALTGTNEPINAPTWFTTFYNEQPLVCGDILCRIRHLPLVPNDVSEQLIRNNIIGNVILFGLGYGVVFALATLVTRTLLTFPWKSWESAIIDSLLQKKTGFSFNRFVRGGVFLLSLLAVIALALAVNNSWLGLTWIWENNLAPLQTLAALVGWIFSPFSGG